MHLLTLGLSHRTAPVELRERLAFPEARIGEASALILQQGIGTEAAVLSTCNRSEIYLVSPDPDTDIFALEQFLSSYHKVPRDNFHGHLYRRLGSEAARQLFRVASGIDSMVLGESQILGQVRSAFEAARSVGAVRLILDGLFRRALTVGKRSRSETSISQGALSVGSAAVELARTIFSSLDKRTVLVLGAGKMSELTVRHLFDSGACSVIVANRTHAQAVRLAEQFRGHAVAFDQLSQYLPHADIVIASTAAPHFVLTYDTLAQTMRLRRGKPIFLIDIAVPRDIDPRVNDLDNVFLYDIDDLQEQVVENRVEREKEVARVETIIDGEVAAFQAWVDQLEVKPLITDLARKAEEVQARRVADALARLPGLSQREQEIIRGLGKSIANELTHGAFSQLREAALKNDGYIDVEVIRRAFLLDRTTEPTNQRTNEPTNQQEP